MMGDTVECPYCKHENDMSDGVTDLPSDNKFDQECTGCGEEFEVFVEFTPSYSGSKIVYTPCEKCGRKEREVRRKGKVFPYPEDMKENVVCNSCYLEAMRDQYLKEHDKQPKDGLTGDAQSQEGASS